MSAFLRALARRIRLAIHRHDPIDAPPKLPVQGPGALCPTCWVRPGEEHELSCREVSPALFADFLARGAL